MQVFGETALASAATRAIALFAVPTGAFLLARRFAPVALAGAATLAIFIVPEVGRMFPVTRTNNLLAAALAPLVVLTFLRWMERQRPGPAVLFGIVSALAILAKATVVVIVISLPVAALLTGDFRTRLRLSQLVRSLVAMVVILLPFGLWLLQNAGAGTASLAKFKPDAGAARGLSFLWERMLASWGPTSLLAAIAWLMSRGPTPLTADIRLVWRAAAVALAAIVVGILVTGSGDIREHWLTATFLPLIPLTVAILVQRSGMMRWLPTAIGGILAIVGLAVLPAEIARRGFDNLDVLRPAVADIERFHPDLVLATRNAAANIVLLDPRLPVIERAFAPPVACGGTVALVTIEADNGRSASLDTNGFVRSLGSCDVEVLSEQKPVPGTTSEWVSWVVLRLTTPSGS